MRQKRGVKHCVVTDPNGYPVRSSFASRVETLEFVGLYGQLIWRARVALRRLDGRADQKKKRESSDDEDEDDEVDLVSFRVRSEKHEVLITVDTHHVFFVLQAQPEDGDEGGAEVADAEALLLDGEADVRPDDATDVAAVVEELAEAVGEAHV